MSNFDMMKCEGKGGILGGYIVRVVIFLFVEELFDKVRVCDKRCNE